MTFFSKIFKSGGSSDDAMSSSPSKISPPNSVNSSLADLSIDPDRAWLKIKQEQTFVPPSAMQSPPQPAGCRIVRFVCISDTHGKHRSVQVPKGDVLIHAGDFSNTGELHQVVDFEKWMTELPYFQQKIVIAGNHDITFQEDYYNARGSAMFHSRKKYDPVATKAVLVNSTSLRYLEDEQFQTLGINIYGSPWQPEFCDWAFNLPRGDQCRAVWSRIPSSTNILITHGPPLGRGDDLAGGMHCGCVDLLHEIQTRVQPLVHVFGHVHEGYGVTADGITSFVNASSCNFRYRCINPAIVFDVAVHEDGTVGAPVFVRSRVSEWDAARVGEWVSSHREPPTPQPKKGSSKSATVSIDGKQRSQGGGGGGGETAERGASVTSTWEDSICDVLQTLTGEELLRITDVDLGTLLPGAASLRSVNAQVDLLLEIRALEAQHF